VSFVASQRVFIVVIVYFVMTQSGNFWIHPRTSSWRGAQLKNTVTTLTLPFTLSVYEAETIFLINVSSYEKIGASYKI
jgi:hypothetical protein